VPLLDVELVLLADVELDVEPALLVDVELEVEVEPVVLEAELLDVEPVVLEAELLEVEPVVLEAELLDVDPVLLEVEPLVELDPVLLDVEPPDPPPPPDDELLEVVAPPPVAWVPMEPHPRLVASSVEASTNDVDTVFMVLSPASFELRCTPVLRIRQRKMLHRNTNVIRTIQAPLRQIGTVHAAAQRGQSSRSPSQARTRSATARQSRSSIMS